MTLLFASNNAHKLDEVRRILPASVTVVSLRDAGLDIDPEENGATLEANSLLKAQAVWDALPQHPGLKDRIDGVFADDTGLEIAALGGQPGVSTARWAGEAHNDAANRAKALRLLQGQHDRTARFRTVITLIMHGRTDRFEGIVNGHIATAEAGHAGFGYDPLFIPEGYDRTFAQLPPEVKNSISHRARALAALAAHLIKVN